MSANKAIHPFADEAIDSNTAPERLAYLSQYRALKPLIAANPATPPDVLEVLGSNKKKGIRRAVALNPNTPLSRLLQLAQELPQEFLANPIVPLLNLSQPDFLKEAPRATLLHLLRCENVPVAWLRWMHSRAGYDERMEAELHVAMSDEVSEAEAARSFERYKSRITASAPKFYTPVWFPVFWLVLDHPTNAIIKECLQHFSLQYMSHKLARSLSDEVLADQTLDPKVRADIARLSHPPRRPELADLQHLARDEDGEWRAWVAVYNPLPEDLCRLLLNDSEPRVRAALARNVKISSDVLVVLARDQHERVRAAAGRSTRLPKELFPVLLQDSAEEVREALACNAQLPASFFEQLARDPSPRIRIGLASNPRTPLALLEILMEAGNMEVRERVEIWKRIAHHPLASPALLTRLVDEKINHLDSGKQPRWQLEIYEAVAAHKRTPVAVLYRLHEMVKAKANSGNSSFIAQQRIWHGMVANPHVPLTILKQILAMTNYHTLFIKIAQHPTMQRNRYRILSNALFSRIEQDIAKAIKPSYYRQLVLEYIDQLPYSLLAAFAHSGVLMERYLVAQHPATPRGIVEMLTHDGNRFVRAVARAALRKQIKNEENNA